MNGSEKIIEISYFLQFFYMVKFTYFCIIGSFSGSSDGKIRIIDSLVVFLDGKINYFKMLYKKFCFYKTYI